MANNGVLQFELPKDFNDQLKASLIYLYRDAMEEAKRDCAVTREMLTIDEACSMYNTSRNTITEKWHKEMGLPLSKLGNKIYIERKVLNDFIRAHPYQ
ncbi:MULTISPECIES: helix-turn-helix domain-containing protein [Aerococcus]|uniref:Helix-turn-helix domain-containing protein n=1 Tax=Aerococcus sanguinicola TaxID=119206 RepID=A0A5N1GNF6_9LACT|nr:MULTISPECIES: helix-turn-helix domain-containing protein [Aerococcus]KAA9301934.1 helix-turn-helix domain-containing protein [Aerococcus sanguinicola]MDK6368643.1 helix-turn-helix domain-containing protein [Aerococcus sp. UMB9870]MDK6679726.1 helix-turn-helix domain-containing protein [Aerococcus sp. UMB8608]MDK6686002.1 helix-turn-helix domain-containing protein [Aerococcus sp. UMB8623]MDK6940808.1 helix-turn-helix domain-containing protein [Aerococcus sp. UMB8487]